LQKANCLLTPLHIIP